MRMGGFDAAGPPEIPLADVMVVGDGDGRTIAQDLAKLATEGEPSGGVVLVIVTLITGEEQQVGILGAEVINDGVTVAPVLVGVAGKHGDGNARFVRRVGTNESFKTGYIAESHPIGHGPGGIPILDAEVSRPTGEEYRGGRRRLPLTRRVGEFEGDLARFRGQ